MKKRKRKEHVGRPERPTNAHFENLIELRESNPKGYARLGEGSNHALENYENEQLASTFEYRAGAEQLLDLKKRLPAVFARLSDETKRKVEDYAERKQAHEVVSGPAAQ